MDNTKDRIRAASLFRALLEDEQKEEIQKLKDSNELLERVSIDESDLHIDSNYRARIFAELLSQLSPDSEYPSVLLLKFLHRYEEVIPDDGHRNQNPEIGASEQVPPPEIEELYASTPRKPRRSPIVQASLWQESEPSESDSETAVETVPRFGGIGTKREVNELIRNPHWTELHQKQKAGACELVIIVPEDEHKEWLKSVEESINEQVPKLLNKTAGKASCSIFRVPQSLVKIHPEAFKPQIVSIGPYHYGAKQLEMIQQHKRRFLGAVLDRTQEFGVGLDEFYKVIAIDEKKIRECYSESTDGFDSRQLIEMMILDGIFIIELLCIVGKLVQEDPDDPIFKSQWIYYSISRDLLRLENQIPFFVLRNLFERSISADSRKGLSLTELILKFFHHSMPEHYRKVRDRFKNNHDWKHLLDFLRSTFIPSSQEKASNNDDLRLIQPVEKLRASGIKFKQSSRTATESFLDIKFKPHGVLEIPC
ncbi:hypothetical protein GH714_001035 [Hevea brasiliensis]|uniref:Uncharacterized protein n=1 Tax=Hevea brasiliensis TaxID=3981 RepID=A0A6A6N8F6_HEVBR|nr:hypothetical protein GH714_001035 [Hevea brasiliensis]